MEPSAEHRKQRGQAKEISLTFQVLFTRKVSIEAGAHNGEEEAKHGFGSTGDRVLKNQRVLGKEPDSQS